MSECLTDELLARLLDGRLTEEERSRVHGHIDTCATCYALVAAVVHNGSSPGDSSPGDSLEASASGGGSRPPPPDGPPPSPPLPPGWRPPETFDEFRLVRPLGQGAMGVVYLAEDTRLRRQVAVKFIASHQPGARARERFQREAQAIAQLKHPNVVTVFRTGEVGEHPYIVTEYLEGTDLTRLPRPVPRRKALHLGLGLSRGLAAAHKAGVLHRDIKPSNAFLTNTGEVKLIDFGLAEVDEAAGPGGTRGPRNIAGTPRYMAPELLEQGATPQSDLYALGMVLYELCTGRLPERSPSLKPASPEGPLLLASRAESMPGIDPDLATLIQRCLRARPEERYGSAEALCTALEQLQVPEVRSEANPYRGLAAFEAEHSDLFFGRNDAIHEVLGRLRHNTLVLVAGDSGVGKSSLCRAGVLPRVSRGALDEYRGFTLLTLEPGRHPLAALAAALAPVLKRPEAELSTWLAGEPGRLGPALREAHAEGRGLLLFVDQLEELITLSEPAQAEHFARLLGELGALTVSASGVRVLLTVRGDFLTRVGALPGLASVVEHSLCLLQPLSPKGVREAIVGPALTRDVFFESEALIQTLVEATARGAGSLPLLQFALAELWERRDTVTGRITRAALEVMGGVDGALSRHADAVLARLDAAEQQAARRLLELLITAEGTRRARTEEELLKSSPEAHTALRALAEGRLLHPRTVEKRASYEIAHEALIASWGTLRHWLEEDAGQRALRQRLEAAGAEWERLGRTEELLWRQRQLDEARALEATALGAREQDFLRASQRAVRRQHVRLGLAVGLVLLVVGALVGVPRLQEYRETQAFVREQLALAQASLGQGHAASQRAISLREKAITLFNGRDPEATGGPRTPQNLWAQAETTWDEALDAFQQADAGYSQAERALDATLERVINHPEARQLRIALTEERLRLAEAFFLKEERTRFLEDFARLTLQDPGLKKRFDMPATLQVRTTPPGARVELTRYVEDTHGVRRREPVGDLPPLAVTPLSPLSLPAGSYHLRFTREGHPPVDLPLLLERGQDEQVDVALPTSVPEGYVYVPPGRFLAGSSDPEDVREFMHSAPLHPASLSQGFLMGRTEVTLGDWMEYLSSPAASPEDRRLLTIARPSTVGALALKALPDGSWHFSFRLPSGRVVEARDGQLLRYPSRGRRQAQDWRRFPLAGVSAEELKGYLDWLHRTGRLPGARLCSEPEWTRAARGADDRRHPHGDRLQKDDANIDLTYGRQMDDFGPDEVGSHPLSVSPFGIHDLAGNVFEVLQVAVPDDLGDYVIRGGGWYHERIGTFIANRQAFNSAFFDPTVGMRLCASWPPR